MPTSSAQRSSLSARSVGSRSSHPAPAGPCSSMVVRIRAQGMGGGIRIDGLSSGRNEPGRESRSSAGRTTCGARVRQIMARTLDRDDLPDLGNFAPDQAVYGVGEVQLRERAALAGPEHLDADRAALLVARDDPGVPPVGPHRRAHLVQRLLDPAVHVAFPGHPLTGLYTSARNGLRTGSLVEWGLRNARTHRSEGGAWTQTKGG